MRSPDLTGRGSAWRISTAAVPQWSPTIDAWLVHVPGAHPFWSHWVISVVHLRDVPGTPPAKKHYPEAEYEFLIGALDPDRPLPDPDDPAVGSVRVLMPIDVVEQFGGVSDEDAKTICEGAVRVVLDGSLSPDQDYRSHWKRLIKNTVEHIAVGGHAKGST